MSCVSWRTSDCVGEKTVTPDYPTDPAAYKPTAIKLGNGFCGASIVSIATYKKSGEQLALHKVPLEDYRLDLDYIEDGLRLIRSIKHPNILQHYASFLCGAELWIIAPLMVHGSARDLINRRYPAGLPCMLISFILRDTLNALYYLHRLAIIHRSIRASHLLLSSNGTVLLSGLRYACRVSRKNGFTSFEFPKDSPGNFSWMAPEILEQNILGYDVSSDIYSVGITALELVQGVAPFEDMSPTQLMLAKLHGVVPRLSTSIADGTTVAVGTTNFVKWNSKEPTIKFYLWGVFTYPSMESLQFIWRDRQNRFHLSGLLVISVALNENGDSGVHGAKKSESFDDFYESCLVQDAEARPSARQLLDHSFVKMCRKSTKDLSALLETPVLEEAKEESVEDGNYIKREADNTEEVTWDLD